MSEMTPMRIGRAATLAVAALVWCGAAWLLWRTSVPSLHLSGFDQRSFFSAHALARSRSYSRGEDVLWLLSTAATLVALVVLVWRLPRSIRQIGLGPIGSAVIAGMVLLVTLWFVVAALQLRRPVVAAPLGARAVRRGGLARLPVVDARAGGRLRDGGDRAAGGAGASLSPAGGSIAWPVIVGIAAVLRIRVGLAQRRRGDAAGEPAAAFGRGAARAGRARERHTCPRAGRLVVDEPGERLHGRIRAGHARRRLEHAARRSLLARRDRRRGGARARPRAQPSRPEGARLDGVARAADAVARRARHPAARRRRRSGQPPAASS